MKALAIKSRSFRYLEKSFKDWLDIQGYAIQTVNNLPVHIRELFYYLESEGVEEINQITIKDIKNHYKRLKTRQCLRGGALSASYLNKHLQGLYKFMDYLRQSGRLELDRLNIKREEITRDLIEILTINEIKDLFALTNAQTFNYKQEALSARDKAMLVIYYSCGLRRNEGVHVDLSDINFDRQLLHVRKGKNYKERHVPFNKTTSKILEDYIYNHRGQFIQEEGERSSLFISNQGTRMLGQSLNKRLKLLCLKSEDVALQAKEISLHTLRHSIATHLLVGGMSLENIARFLGHSSLESTQLYTHLAQPSLTTDVESSNQKQQTDE